MYKINWDVETGGVLLNSRVLPDTLGISPRPVFWEELDLLKLDKKGWSYPPCDAPLLWACNKQYYYRGQFVFEVKGANIYDEANVILQPGAEALKLEPVDVPVMLEKNRDQMFLIESEAIEFIRSVYLKYSHANKLTKNIAANQLDFESILIAQEKRTKQKMAIVKEDCDSFEIIPLEKAENQKKSVYQTTRVDRFLASFSGGKDSQVVLDLVTRAIPPDQFEVIYSDTGYELPPSLDLYEEVKTHYGKLYPSLKFDTARNHRKVLEYWDQIGTPSDAHRWCCSIMKTAPLYRKLKIEGNKQAKVLTFDGVRSEESTGRSEYNRIGKGVKHGTVINARPILNWNNTEVYLYIFKYKLPMNLAYRQGKSRVGCLICPFSTSWDDMIANKVYKKELKPFLERIIESSKKGGVKDIDNYIKDRKWKFRATGNLVNQSSSIIFDKITPDFVATVKNAKQTIETWLPTLGKYTLIKDGNDINGQLRFEKTIYKFMVESNPTQHTYKFTLYNANNARLIGLLKRVLYKTTYCISCEACEVECPTGALTVVPKVEIDKSKCIHCYKCLEFHERGCVVANSLMITSGNNMTSKTSIDRYKTFGLKEDWVDSFFYNTDNFWGSNHGLNQQYQIPSLKSWLKEAEIIDEKGNLSELGKVLSEIYQDRKELVWEIIWINLTYNSFIVNWYASRIQFGTSFTKGMIREMIQNEFPNVYGERTVKNAVDSLIRTLKESPLSTSFNMYVALDKENSTREAYNDLSEEAVAYSIYKYGEKNNIRMLRVSDFFRRDVNSGAHQEFGIEKNQLQKQLHTLNSAKNRVIIAELNMGLDHITLRDDLNTLEAFKIVLSV